MSTDRPAPKNSIAVILAAGKSTRMRSRLPKPLHPICGRALTRHVIEACKGAGIERIMIVIGHESESVRAGLGDDVEYVIQEAQRGSGDAARAAEPLLIGHTGPVLVLAGDVPLLRSETLERLLAHHEETEASASLLTAVTDDPTGYGRVIRNDNGSVARIVEHRDASEQERTIREWNPSLYAFRSQTLFDSLRLIRPDNVQGELYLTDVIQILASRGESVEAVVMDDPDEALGVNTRIDLAAVSSILRKRILERLMRDGVTIVDPAATYIDVGVKVGQDTLIEPQTFLRGDSVVGEDCVIGPFARIESSSIGDGSCVVASTIVRSVVGNDVKIGPYANVRAACTIEDGAKIGDFVELNRSRIGPGVSAAHLTYLGDTEVGEQANIGAGTITCNYDGRKKNHTTIGPHAFIGSHTTIIAPVTIGEGAVTGAGSVIVEDVPEGALAIARERQTIKPGWAIRRMKG